MLGFTLVGFAPLWLLWGAIVAIAFPPLDRGLSGRLENLVAIAACAGSWVAVHQLCAACVVAPVLRACGRKVERPAASLPATVGRCFAILGVALACGIATFVGILAGILPGVIVATVWLLASCVLAAEGGSIGRALARSRELTRGRRLGIGFLLVAVSFVVLTISIWGTVGILILAGPHAFTEFFGVTTALVVGFFGSILDVMIAVTYLMASDRVDRVFGRDVARIFA